MWVSSHLLNFAIFIWLGQVANFLGFLTLDTSVIWNTGDVHQNVLDKQKKITDFLLCFVKSFGKVKVFFLTCLSAFY